MAEGEGADDHLPAFVPAFLDDDPNRRFLGDDPSEVDSTYLSTRLRAAVEDLKRQFSWVYPRRHGLRSFNHNDNPIPIPVDQGDSEFCIPYQVYNFIKLQMNIMASLTRPALVEVEVPEVSLDYLIKIFKAFDEESRNFDAFLSSLHSDGFVDIGGYDIAGKSVLPGARRYYIHWCKGFGHVGRSDIEFENDLKNSILYQGGVLAEMITSTDLLDPNGDEISGSRVKLK